jgi:UDP-N-acetylmuramate--alanine ligase
MTDPRSHLAHATRVHMVGIGGSGMAALATLLLRMGKRVSGSDLALSSATAALKSAGALVHVGHRPEHVHEAEYVIRSSAVSEVNPEVAESFRRGLPSVKLAEAVGELMLTRQGVAVAGTHGKTTTTALVAWLLERAGLDPLALIGAEALNFESSARNGAGPMVVEADEYDRRFLQLSPRVAVVTSVEPDHLDYFRDLDEIRGVFQTFVDRLSPDGRLVVCADDAGAAQLESRAQRDTYGFSPYVNWRASDYAPVVGRGSRFKIESCGRQWEAE